MTVLGSLLRSRPQSAIRSDQFWGAWARGEDVSPSSPAGVPVTRETAQALSAVWACRNLIASTIASLPADIFKRQEGIRRPARPKPDWVEDPNADMSRFQVVEQALDSMLLEGTAFLYTPRDRAGRTSEIWPVHPARCHIRRENGRVVYDVWDPELGLDRPLRGGPGGEMFHIPAYSPPGSLRGMPPLEVARSMLGGGLAAQEFSGRFFGKGLNMSGVIETEDDLEVDQARELKRDFRRIHQGLANAFEPAVLIRAKWQPLAVTPEQAQFIETRRFTKADVATFFLVPPHMIGETDRSTSWGSGIEQQTLGFLTFTLRQWIERIEQAFTHYLLWDQPGVFFRFNVEGLLRAQTEKRYQGYAIARNWGWLSVDDIRTLEDMAPLPDGAGQDYLQPANMIVAGSEPAPEGGTA